MKLAGRIATWAGALLLVIAMFLHFTVSVTGNNVSLWSGAARPALLLLLLALTAVGASIVSLFVDRPVLVGAQFGLTVYLFGEALSIGQSNFSHLQIGFWLGLIAALAMLVGASLMVAGIWSRAGWRPTTGLLPSGRSVGSAPYGVPAAPAGAAAPAAAGPAAVPPAPDATVAADPRAQSSPAMTPAGWYPDPSGQAAQRYWSGTSWTEHTQP